MRPLALAGVKSLFLLVTVVASAVTAYRLTRHLGSSAPILWAILMFIPCVNILGRIRPFTWGRPSEVS